MCDSADYTYDVLTSRQQRARKEHKCCACSETIRRGDVYQRSFACSREGADSYKHCLRCSKMLDAIRDALPSDTAIAWELDCGELWTTAIGDLPEDIAALAFMTADEAQRRLNCRPMEGM